MPEARFTDIRHFDSIDSTNQYLLDEARRGAPDGVVAVAEHQSSGRGRLGRRWEAPPGSNLLVSVLLRPDLPADHRQLAGAVMALAAKDAVAESTGLDLGIKWPNDLLGPDGRKLAGVLAEADVHGGVDPVQRRTVRLPIVVGIGINVNWPAADADLPDELVGRATSLREQVGHPVDRAALLAALLAALGARASDLESEAGRVRQSADFRAGCTTIGTAVRVELPGEEFEGKAVDLTLEGHLIVAVDGENRTVVAGDVVHLRPADGKSHPVD
jgi:BirA family transcriptional regulator, biotin operon repressor / biotin---[acetyl-CoA-carboxylase] ligase